MQHSRRARRTTNRTVQTRPEISADDLPHDNVRWPGKKMGKNNFLLDYHILADTFINAVMTDIMLDCGWSRQVYWRKRKDGEKANISTAEADKAIEIMIYRKEEFDRYFALFIAGVKAENLPQKRR